MKHAAVAALLLLPLAGVASADDYPRPDGYVLDEGGFLRPGVEARLERLLADYDARTTNQVGVALVHTLDGIDPADYGFGLFNAWGIGTAEKDNGVLLLLAVDDRASRIQVGLGVEELLTDEEAQTVLDDVLAPAARAGNLDAAVLRSVSAIRAQLGEPRAPARAVAPKQDPFTGGEAQPLYPDDVVAEPVGGGDYPTTTYPVTDSPGFSDDFGEGLGVFVLFGLGIAVSVVLNVLRAGSGRPSGSGTWFGSSLLDSPSSRGWSRSSGSTWGGSSGSSSSFSGGSSGGGSSFGGGSSGGGGASGGW